jgi:hypothetical protein
MRVAWWCSSQAAEVHNNPEGMSRLAGCFYNGLGVTKAGAYTRRFF